QPLVAQFFSAGCLRNQVASWSSLSILSCHIHGASPFDPADAFETVIFSHTFPVCVSRRYVPGPFGLITICQRPLVPPTDDCCPAFAGGRPKLGPLGYLVFQLRT